MIARCASRSRSSRSSRPTPPPIRRRRAPTTRASTACYLGKTAAQVIAAHGEPDCKSPRKWRYWFPQDCAYEKDVVTLRFDAHARVARATVVHIITGEECAFGY